MKVTFCRTISAGGYSERCKPGFRTAIKRRPGRLDIEDVIPGLDRDGDRNVSLNHFLKALTVEELARIYC